MKKKIFCIILCIALAFVFCGCGGNQTDSPNQNSSASDAKNSTITILCNRSDSFNPYTAKSETNRNLCLLLFDPLIRLDNNFNVDYCLAESVLLEGSTCTVKLKNVKFSDGSTLTAEDVIASYNIAKDSATAYSAQLYSIASAEATDTKTVVFTLTKSDPYFVNLLDFPILKNGTADITDEDGVALTPIGCGRYLINSDKTALSVNEGYYKKAGNIRKINLLHAPDNDSIAHYVEVGASSLYYTDISDGTIVRMSGKKTDVNLNTLVYIGINGSFGDLAGKNMRYAISSAINRTDICNKAYYNNAVPASGFFNPAFEVTAPVQTIGSKNNNEITIENLSEIGYNTLDDEGYFVNSSGKKPSYALLVNGDNASRVQAAKLIAAQLKSAGIKVNVVEKPFEQYLADIQANHFELYLGETAILNNMDFSPLVVRGGSMAFGVAAPPSKQPDEAGGEENEEENNTLSKTVCEAAIENFYSGGSITDLAGTLLTEMPQIPICYRTGMLFYSDNIGGEVISSHSDIYYSINSYNIK